MCLLVVTQLGDISKAIVNLDYHYSPLWVFMQISNHNSSKVKFSVLARKNSQGDGEFSKLTLLVAQFRCHRVHWMGYLWFYQLRKRQQSQIHVLHVQEVEWVSQKQESPPWIPLMSQMRLYK